MKSVNHEKARKSKIFQSTEMKQPSWICSICHKFCSDPTSASTFARRRTADRDIRRLQMCTSCVTSLAHAQRSPPPPLSSVRRSPFPCLLSASFSLSSLSPRSVLCPQYGCPSAARRPERPSPHTRRRSRRALFPPQHNAGFLAITSCLRVNNASASSTNCRDSRIAPEPSEKPETEGARVVYISSKSKQRRSVHSFLDPHITKIIYFVEFHIF